MMIFTKQKWEWKASRQNQLLKQQSDQPSEQQDLWEVIPKYKVYFISFIELYVSFSHEIININLKNKPDWFFEKNPLGLVPVLEDSKGKVVYESVITCEYLDEAYPGKKLWPEDPYEKARQKMIFELSTTVCA